MSEILHAMNNTTTVPDVGNPISIIKNKLLMLRHEKDATEMEIESLQNEKISIRKTIPKLLHVLIQHRDNINEQQVEINILGMCVLMERGCVCIYRRYLEVYTLHTSVF